LIGEKRMQQLLQVYSIVIAATMPLALCAAVTITPSRPPAVVQGGTIKFSSNVPVTWSLAPGSAGSIDQTGTYRAPFGVTPKNSFGGCQILPNNHVLNTRVDSLPVHASSASWMSRMRSVHGAHKRVKLLSEAGGFPVNRVLPATSTTALTFAYTPSNNGLFQFPTAAEGGEIQGGWYVAPFSRDRHMLNIRPDTCDISEIYNVYPVGANTSCPACTSQSGIKYSSDAYALPANGATTAAGMMILPLTLRTEELDRALATGGSIEHALAISIHNGVLSKSKVWPAQTVANGWGPMPWGSRLRLRASFTYTSPTHNPYIPILLRQMKQYGFIVADGSSTPMGVPTLLTGPIPQRMKDAFREFASQPGLGSLGDYLEVVDESSLQPRDSAGPRADWGAVRDSTRADDVVRVIATETGNSASTASVDVPLAGVAIGFFERQLHFVAGAGGKQLAVEVSGVSDPTVKWEISPAGIGTLSAAGVYTPPATITQPVRLTVKATSVMDPSSSATQDIVVLPDMSASPDSKLYLSFGTGSNYKDSKGRQWWNTSSDGTPLQVLDWGLDWDHGGTWTIADLFFDSHVFKKERNAYDALKTVLQVPNGSYKLTLLMGGGAAGFLKQSLEVQYKIVAKDIDPGGFKPVRMTFPVTVTDGQLEFAIRNQSGPYVTLSSAVVEADAVLAKPEPPATTAIRVNCGGPGFTDAKGNVWAADNGWAVLSGDIANYNTGLPVANTTPDMYPLYQSHRYNRQPGTFRYSFPGLEPGKYNVTLKWSDVDRVSWGNRMHVSINGTVVLEDFNPTEAAGGVQRAIDQTFPITVSNGAIQIDFTRAAAAGYVGASINGIEIVPAL
jgi:hypothetical protein